MSQTCVKSEDEKLGNINEIRYKAIGIIHSGFTEYPYPRHEK